MIFTLHTLRMLLGKISIFSSARMRTALAILHTALRCWGVIVLLGMLLAACPFSLLSAWGATQIIPLHPRIISTPAR